METRVFEICAAFPLEAGIFFAVRWGLHRTAITCRLYSPQEGAGPPRMHAPPDSNNIQAAKSLRRIKRGSLGTTSNWENLSIKD